MARVTKTEARERLRKLRSEASEAIRKGQLRKAVARYGELETLEPADAQWCCRLADLHARLGEKTEEIDALVRAAERFAAGGFALRAIAVCRRILDLDPLHTRAQERLAALHPAKEPPAPSARAATAVPDHGPPLAPGPLTEILLEDVCEPDPAAAALASRVLPTVPLFGELGPASFERLVRAVRLVRLREDRVLFREGDPGDALYVVVEGAVVPCAERPTPRRLAVLQEGEFFGEVALVSDQPRIATVRALVDTSLLELDADTLRVCLREEPALGPTLLRFLRERLLHRLGQTSPLFEGLDAAALRRVAARFRFRDVQDGMELVVQGATKPGLFVALCGRFEVTAHDGMQARTLAELEPGDVFGEMSLLSGEPAMATVTARGRGFVLALDADGFRGLQSVHSRLESGLRALAVERDRRNEETLRDPRDAFRRRVELV